MWTKQKTRRGDTLVSLARAYGTSVDAILLANNVTPASRHTDGYLVQQAKQHMLPLNLNRSVLSKLVQEHDIHQWARSIGADCEPIRQTHAWRMNLVSCQPGAYCRFGPDCEIVLPTKRPTLAGLGAVTSVDIALELAQLPNQAKMLADAVVNNISLLRVIDRPRAESWRTVLVGHVTDLVNAALKKDANGRHNFERQPVIVQRLRDFVHNEIVEGRAEFSFSAQVNALVTSFQNKIASLTNALTTPAAVPSTATVQPKPPVAATSKAKYRAVSTKLADIRADATKSLERGQTGPGVRELQALLVQKGRKIAVDAIFGPETEAALRATVSAPNGKLTQAVLRLLEQGKPVAVQAVTASPGKGMLVAGAAFVVVVAAVALSD